MWLSGNFLQRDSAEIHPSRRIALTACDTPRLRAADLHIRVRRTEMVRHIRELGNERRTRAFGIHALLRTHYFADAAVAEP
jgi:hypothetical protein